MDINMNIKINSYQYKIIFSDIDGTLLNSRHRVPEDTRKEILKLEQEGVPFVLVSARMPEGMVTIQKEIGNKAPMVCYSGALVLGEDGETLYSRYMDGDTALEIKELMDREHRDICCNTYGDGVWAVHDAAAPWVVKEDAITSLKAARGSVREILDSRVEKSAGVRFLCDYYGITMEQAMAFGDGCNDIDMLKAVKNSYAMANAPKEVRDRAAHVTLDNDHEGLLAALKEDFT